METGAADIVETTRWEILNHARELFAHFGFAKTSMADIAGRSGMSPGNLYRYYRNKRDIGLTLVEVFLRENEAAIEAALIGVDDPEKRIRVIIRISVERIVAEMERHPRIIELVDFITSSEETYAVLQDHIHWKRGKVERELTRGMDAGVFRRQPVYETAVNLMHATKAFQVPHSLAEWRDPATIMPELEGVLDLIFTGVRSAP